MQHLFESNQKTQEELDRMKQVQSKGTGVCVSLIFDSKVACDFFVFAGHGRYSVDSAAAELPNNGDQASAADSQALQVCCF